MLHPLVPSLERLTKPRHASQDGRGWKSGWDSCMAHTVKQVSGAGESTSHHGGTPLCVTSTWISSGYVGSSLGLTLQDQGCSRDWSVAQWNVGYDEAHVQALKTLCDPPRSPLSSPLHPPPHLQPSPLPFRPPLPHTFFMLINQPGEEDPPEASVAPGNGQATRRKESKPVNDFASRVNPAKTLSPIRLIFLGPSHQLMCLD